MYMYIEYHFYADKSIISYVKERTDTQYQTIYNLDVSILRSLFENVQVQVFSLGFSTCICCGHLIFHILSL